MTTIYKYKTFNLDEIFKLYAINNSIAYLKFNALMSLNALDFIMVMSNKYVMYEFHTFLRKFKFKFHSFIINRNPHITMNYGVIHWIPDDYHIHWIDNICVFGHESKCYWCLGLESNNYISSRDKKEKYMLYMYKDISLLLSGRLKNVVDFIHNYCEIITLPKK